jgi:hypothetical protein
MKTHIKFESISNASLTGTETRMKAHETKRKVENTIPMKFQK